MKKKTEKSNKKHKGLKIFGCIVLVLVLFFVTINIIPPKKNLEENPFVLKEGQPTMIAAHRGGAAINPENTLLAFKEAVLTYNVDIVESDIYMTKDGYLVFNHDSYIDETCNINGDISYEDMKALIEDESKRHYIADMTLEELQQYNFGYYFEDENGERIYKDVEDFKAIGLQMATADQLFEFFYESHPDLMFILEIKNEGEEGKKACKIFYDMLKERFPNYLDQIVVGTFKDEIGEELKENYPDLLDGAAPYKAAQFVLTQYLGVNLFDNSSFSTLQIPVSYDIGFDLNLVSKSLVNRAHKRNIAVQYWTINDPDEMRTLIELGADCLMTDNPKLMREILEEYK